MSIVQNAVATLFTIEMCVWCVYNVWVWCLTHEYITLILYTYVCALLKSESNTGSFTPSLCVFEDILTRLGHLHSLFEDMKCQTKYELWGTTIRNYIKHVWPNRNLNPNWGTLNKFVAPFVPKKLHPWNRTPVPSVINSSYFKWSESVRYLRSDV